MLSVWIAASSEEILQPTQVALGNFDGVHCGHRAVIGALFGPSGTADKRTEPLSYATVVSFNPHPHVFFSGQPKPLLTTLTEKTQILETLGVQQLVLLSFNETLATLTPEAFVEQILIQQLQAQCISVGFDFHFGHNRSGTVQDLQIISERYGIPVMVVAPNLLAGERISSSSIRQALAMGKVELATQLLGRPYTLTGTIGQGQQLGRTLGFPTANLRVAAEKFIPAQGVYRVLMQGPAFVEPQLGVMNIGQRPTVNGHRLTIEIHVLDWSGDLYGHTVTVHLQQFLRPEQKFASLEALKAQIAHDCQAARMLG
jgi:riboflavin kinase / FMN adenylyltransferase